MAGTLLTSPENARERVPQSEQLTAASTIMPITIALTIQNFFFNLHETLFQLNANRRVIRIRIHLIGHVSPPLLEDFRLWQLIRRMVVRQLLHR